jgi:subtilisin family serine protease
VAFDRVRYAILAGLAGAALLAAQPQDFVTGRVLVKFRSGVTETQRTNVLGRHSSRTLGTVGQTGVHIVQVAPGASERDLVAQFKTHGEVEFAELDRIVPPADIIPNDPWYANWEWHLPKISAPTAWSTTTGSASVVIAVIDTGVDPTHPDLASKLVPGWNIYANNSDTHDTYGHGTQVAGTIGAVSNNGVGVASVCWNCMIMPVLVSDSTGSATYSNLAAGTTWAADHGARVANMSYMVTDSSTVTSAAQYFQSKGGVVTSSAGNYSSFDSTSDNPYILTVSATDPNDALYSWSNTGNNVDLSAPGCVYTTTVGGGYGSACGTSFSAPIVAAVAGLVYSLNSSLSPSQVTQILDKNADDLGPAGWDATFGWGRVNAARAVAAASGGGGTGGTGGGSPTTPTVSFQSPTGGSTVSGTVSVQVAAADGSGIASVSFYVDNALYGTSSVAPYSWPWNTGSASNGGHSLSAVAKSNAGMTNTANSSVTVSNVAPDTTAPTASITSPSSGSTVSGMLTITANASDNVRVASVDLLVDGAVNSTDTSTPYNFKVNTKQWAKGAHTLQVRAKDPSGNVGLSAVVTVYK